MTNDGRFEKGDLVSYSRDNKIYYFVDYFGKQRIGDGPWEELAFVCPLRKGRMLPDNRVLKSIFSKFRYRVKVNELNGDW